MVMLLMTVLVAHRGFVGVAVAEQLEVEAVEQIPVQGAMVGRGVQEVLRQELRSIYKISGRRQPLFRMRNRTAYNLIEVEAN
jgi:hypothetical protein